MKEERTVKEDVVTLLAERLLTLYRFLLAYPEAIDLVETDALGLLESLECAGYRVVKADE